MGIIGKEYAEAAADLAECQLVVAGDVKPIAEQIARAIDAKYFGDYQEMIEKEDLAVQRSIQTGQPIVV